MSRSSPETLVFFSFSLSLLTFPLLPYVTVPFRLTHSHRPLRNVGLGPSPVTYRRWTPQVPRGPVTTSRNVVRITNRHPYPCMETKRHDCSPLGTTTVNVEVSLLSYQTKGNSKGIPMSGHFPDEVTGPPSKTCSHPWSSSD